MMMMIIIIQSEIEHINMHNLIWIRLMISNQVAILENV